MLRVTSIDANAVTLATGSVNLRRFTQRPNEVLVVGQLLDARAVILGTQRPAVIVDAAMEPTRTRDWMLGRLAIRERTGRLSRRGPIQVLPWEELEAPGVTDLASSPQGATHLLSVFEGMRAADVAAALRELPAKRRYEVADNLDD